MGGNTVVVKRGDGPSADVYLFIAVEGREFFLGRHRDGMTRGEVRRLALGWLRQHSVPEAGIG